MTVFHFTVRRYWHAAYSSTLSVARLNIIIFLFPFLLIFLLASQCHIILHTANSVPSLTDPFIEHHVQTRHPRIANFMH